MGRWEPVGCLLLGKIAATPYDIRVLVVLNERPCFAFILVKRLDLLSKDIMLYGVSARVCAAKVKRYSRKRWNSPRILRIH